MNLSFLRRTGRRHTAPHAQPATVPVNVMATERDEPVDALPFNPDPHTADTIRTHLWLQRNAREGQA